MSTPGRLWVMGTLVLALPGCPPEVSQEQSSEPIEGSAPPAPELAREAVYERDLLFLGWEGDTAVMVPWFLSARTREDGVVREASAWLGRGGVWESFYEDRWETPLIRGPWRVLPHGPMRIMIGPGDVVTRLVFDEGPRQLELILEDTFVEWAGQRGEMFRVLDGAVMISNLRLDGILLDMTRARAATDPTPGDWVFLTSGDSLVVLLVDPGRRDPDAELFYSGWAILDAGEQQWPAVVVEWSRVRPVDQARRQVPDAWTITSVDGNLSGSLEAVTSHVTVGEGEEPLLPVDALFEVRGELRVNEQEISVSGLVRHLRR